MEMTSASCLGLSLESPFIVASGPLTDRRSQIRKALASGAGAVVTKTIFVGEMAELSERSFPIQTGLLNSTLYSHRPVSYWTDTFKELAGLPVIASIHADDPSQLGDLAGALYDAGCRAFELGIACPNDGAQQGLTPDDAYSYTKCARDCVPCPISVKLAAVSEMYDQVNASLEAGANAISLSDTIPALSVDVNSSSVRFGEAVGYSGPGIRPLVLQALWQVRRLHPDVELIGIGGIESLSDALEYLMLGCGSVQLYTALLSHGFALTARLREDLSAWCSTRGMQLDEVIGSALERQDAS